MTQPQVTLYTRAGCCLCEDAHRVLKAAAERVSFELAVVDIDSDPELQRLYNDEVPVIAIDGRKAFKYRITVDDFLKRLKART